MKNTVKKVLLFSVVAVLMACFAFCVSAADIEDTGNCGDNVKYTLYSDGKLVISGSGSMKPKQIFSYNYRIKSVSVQSGVTNVGGFRSCESLESVILADSVTKINSSAFEDCINLESVSFSKNLSKIGEAAFKNCSKLTEVSLHESAKAEIEISAFSDCTSLVSVDAKAVKNVDMFAFAGCSKLKTANFSKNGITISDGAFRGCSSLTSTITIADSWDCVPFYAFEGCSSLNAVVLPDTIIEIHADSFKGCNSLKNIYFKGTEKQWSEITGKNHLPSAEIHFGDYSGHTHSYKKTTVKATVTADGRMEEKCTECGKVKNRTVIKKVSGIKLSASSFMYNGKTKKPSVTVKDSAGKVLQNNRDYKINYSNSKSKNVGKYKATVTLMGNYTGKKVLEYSIAPKETAFESLKADSGAFTVSWSKQTSQTTGYEIQYSTKKNFKSAKTVTVKKNKTVSKKITGLKGKKKYYVRIRTYKIVGKTKVYSAWSAAKNITTKQNIGISLNTTDVTLYLGGTKTVKSSVYPSDAKIKWSTDKKSVATVSGGKIKAVKKGRAVITASFKYKGKTYKATCKVTVKAPSLNLNKTSATLEKGEKFTLKATVAPSNGKIKWATSDASVATVKNGVVTAKGKGKAVITATLTLNGKKYKKECTVKVTSLLDIMEEGFTAELIVPSVGTQNSYCQVKYTNHTGSDVLLTSHVFANGKGCYNSDAFEYVLEDGYYVVVKYYRDIFYLNYYKTKDMYLDYYSTAYTSVDIKGKQVHLKFGTDGGTIFGYTEADIGVY